MRSIRYPAVMIVDPKYLELTAADVVIIARFYKVIAR